MFDLSVQIAILLIGLPCVAITTYIRRDVANPVNIVFVSFFIPMFFSLYRLAGIQLTEWSYETYVGLLTSLGAWILLPTIVLCITAPPRAGSAPSVSMNLEPLHGPAFAWAVRIYALIVVGAFFASNYIQVKTLLPLTLPEEAFQLHTEFPGGLRFFARATPAAAILLYVLFFTQRSKLDLLFLILVVATPLSRLSRIDLAMSFVAIAILAWRLPLFKMTRPRLILLVALLAGLLIGGAELGNLRQNRFGLYEFKYSDFIKWKPQYVGPAEIFAVLYGYFPLSFENFDAFVRQFKGGHSYVLWSFDWFFTGFIKMNWIPGFAMAQADAFQFTPISSAANVPTALSPFYADAGAVGMAVPLAFYVCVWAYLYHRSRSSVAHLTLFALYAGAFALSSFQAVVAAAFIAHQMAEILLIMAITWRLHARQKRRESVRLTLQGAL